MKFNEKLIQLRKENNLTQNQLAEKINISRQSISKWENDHGYPDIANLIKISELYNLSLDELLKNDRKLEKKIIKDSKSNKYHLLSVIYMIAILIYIAYFYFKFQIFMIGFLIATIFMLGIELYFYFRKQL